MDRWKTSNTAVLVIVTLVFAFCVAGPAAAEEKRVVKERIVLSDGEEGEHRVVFVDEDGEVQHLDGDELHRVHANLDDDALVVRLHGMHGGFLGVQFSEMTSELREHFGVSGDAGVMVSKIVEGGPADQAGVQVGDILTRVDDLEITSGRGLVRAVREREEGETVALEVYRDGRPVTLSATLEEMDGMHHAGHKRVMMLRCPEGEDCESHHMPHMELHEQCEGLERCEVKINCEDGGVCTCTVNGETAECPEGIDP